MPDFLPQNPADLALWLGNAATVGNSNLAGYGLTTADIAALTNAKAAIDATNADYEAKEQAFRAASEARKTAVRNGELAARAFARKVGGNAAVTNPMRAAAGLTVRDAVPSPVVPLPPVNKGFADGTNALRWNGGGNKPGTLYLVEALVGDSDTWVLIDTVTAARYDHRGQTPGVKVSYRVRAKRRTEFSAYSNEATVYANF